MRFGREKPTQDENVRFIKGNGLKLIQVKLLSLYIFKSVDQFTAQQAIIYFKTNFYLITKLICK